jgi:hypothetical protein
MKSPQPMTKAERPTAQDTLSAIVAYRFPTRTPSLAEIVRVVGGASYSMRYANREEKMAVENSVVMATARQLGIVA